MERKGLLFRIVCSICVDPGENAALYTVIALYKYAMFIGMDKLIRKELIPYSVHQLAFQMGQNWCSGWRAKYFGINFIDVIGKLLNSD